MELNINCDAAVIFADKLERIGRSALPNAIRETLSKTALHVKRKSMPGIAAKTFTQRNKTFFKANSVVDFAKGKDIDTMHSAVGFNSTKLKGGSNFAVKNLEQQEYGGKIGGKSFVPLVSARVSNSYKKNVRANARISKIKNIVKARNQKGESAAQRLIQAAAKAGKGGYVSGSTKKGENILWKVNDTKGKKRAPLYDYSKGRKIKVEKTEFLERSARISQRQMNRIFVANAKMQIDKYTGIKL